jgi:hypothetical protein
MSAATQRDLIVGLAKNDPSKALEKAQQIPDCWYKSQALAWVARYSDKNTVKVAKLAAKAASECEDEYKKTGVRAWEIAALAERNNLSEARSSLRAAVKQSKGVMPLSSRAEALILLLQAAFKIGSEEASWVSIELKNACGNDSHWRCKRAIRDAGKMLGGDIDPRQFFW